MSRPSGKAEPPIRGLEEARTAAARGARPPLARWNPPSIGDIGLSIAADGSWQYRGSPIEREALVRLFASVLRREADGRHYLVTPVEKCPVAVDDAPFLAVEMEAAGEGRAQSIRLRTNLGEEVTVGEAHPLRFARETGGGLKPYVALHDGLEALATRAVALDLAGRATVERVDGADWFGLWSGGRFFAMAPAAELDA